MRRKGQVLVPSTPSITEARHLSIKALIRQIKAEAIHQASEQNRITTSKGRKQNWLIDLRPILLEPEWLLLICDLFWDRFQERLPFQIGGMEVAAVPLVTALIMSGHQRGLNVSGFVIRKSRKRTGLGRRIEGQLNDNPIVLVDDIFNSGTSMSECKLALSQEERCIDSVFSLIDYRSSRGRKWQKETSIQVHSLMSLKDFDLSLARKKKPQSDQHTILWRFFEPGAFPYHVVPKSTPLIVENQIFMGTDIGKMVCVDRQTGHKVWDYDTQTHHPKGIWSSPAYFEGKIYFGAYDGNVYCLNANDGTLVWKNPCSEFVGSSPLIVPELRTMFLGLEHQRPRQMGSNAAFDLDSSNRIWETAQHKYQHGSAAYSARYEAVIFGNADHNITAYKAKTGEKIWELPTERSLKYPPTVSDEMGIVAAASFDGKIYIVKVGTGQLVSAVQTNDICYTTPLISHGKIYCGSGDRHLYVIEARTGQLIKKIDCGARVYSSPRMIGGRVVFGTSGGRIIELCPDTLVVLSESVLPDAITNAIGCSSDEKTLYVSTCMNEIYAIERKA